VGSGRGNDGDTIDTTKPKVVKHLFWELPPKLMWILNFDPINMNKPNNCKITLYHAHVRPIEKLLQPLPSFSHPLLFFPHSFIQDTAEADS
jgi:hypothetical protein